jgi:hypothetical protein
VIADFSGERPRFLSQFAPQSPPFIVLDPERAVRFRTHSAAEALLRTWEREGGDARGVWRIWRATLVTTFADPDAGA